MGTGGSLAIIVLLIACSGFFSVAEIALASSRRGRLRQLAEQGDARAERALLTQEEPGTYFTVVQIGQNMVAILGGSVGAESLSPVLSAALLQFFPEASAKPLAAVLSLAVITSAFILFADLIPRRMAMAEPEQLAIRALRPMRWVMRVMFPVVWLFRTATDILMRVAGLPERRDDQVTSADVLAVTAAAAKGGELSAQNQQVIENLLQLDTRLAQSAMTPRDSIAYLLLDDDESTIATRVAQQPHIAYLVCKGNIDRVIGRVNAADLLARLVLQKPLRLQGEGGLLQEVLLLSNHLRLSEVLARLRRAHQDFAVLVDDRRLVVGVLTLDDVLSFITGSLVDSEGPKQIVRVRGAM